MVALLLSVAKIIHSHHERYDSFVKRHGVRVNYFAFPDVSLKRWDLVWSKPIQVNVLINVIRTLFVNFGTLNRSNFDHRLTRRSIITKISGLLHEFMLRQRQHTYIGIHCTCAFIRVATAVGANNCNNTDKGKSAV